MKKSLEREIRVLSFDFGGAIEIERRKKRREYGVSSCVREYLEIGRAHV